MMKTFKEFLNEEEADSSDVLFDQLPESLSKDIDTILKYMNKNVFNQYKIKVPQLNFIEKRNGALYFKSAELVGTQLGVMGLWESSAFIQFVIRITGNNDKAQGTFFVVSNGDTHQFAEIRLELNRIYFKPSDASEYLIIDDSKFGVGNN